MILVEPYTPLWKTAYASEVARIKRAMPDDALQLHHIGSTSVPGLAAKPIIDMLAQAPSLQWLDKCSGALTGLGYEAMGEFGIPGRRYFRRTAATGTRTHHLHAFALDSPHIERHIAFRDYLIAHADVAERYGALKQLLAEQSRGDMHIYMDGKDGFVRATEAAALQWRARLRG